MTSTTAPSKVDDDQDKRKNQKQVKYSAKVRHQEAE
jgi:hypothetical protein